MTEQELARLEQLAAAATPDVFVARRRLTDAMHAMHADQMIRVDMALATELKAAWDNYDATLLRAATSAEVRRLRGLLADVQATLRAECADLGDDDWPDTLHPADVIEKHLARPARGEIARLRGALEQIASHGPPHIHSMVNAALGGSPGATAETEDQRDH